MSLEVNIGKRGNILEVGPENASQVCMHVFCPPLTCSIFYFSADICRILLFLVIYSLLLTRTKLSMYSDRLFCLVLC